MSERLVCPKCGRPAVRNVDWRMHPYLQCTCGYACYLPVEAKPASR